MDIVGVFDQGEGAFSNDAWLPPARIECRLGTALDDVTGEPTPHWLVTVTGSYSPSSAKGVIALRSGGADAAPPQLTNVPYDVDNIALALSSRDLLLDRPRDLLRALPQIGGEMARALPSGVLSSGSGLESLRRSLTVGTVAPLGRWNHSLG